MLVTFFVSQVFISPHSPSKQLPATGSTARHAATAAWMLLSVSGFLGVVVVDVGVAAGALVDAEVVEAALLLPLVVVVDVGVAAAAFAAVVGETCSLACCCAVFGAVFGAAPGAAGHPAGW